MKTALWGAARVIVPVCAVLLLAALLPEVQLDGAFAWVAYWISLSGSKFVVPWIALGLLLWVAGGKRDAAVFAAVLAVLLGGGSYVNEHVVKPWLAVPRPNVLALADSGALGMTATAFYAIPDKTSRSRHLRVILDAGDPRLPPLQPRVLQHWIHESGFSSPSGHSLAAMLCATFFLGAGILTGRRRWLLYVLVGWAVLVCVSRVILRVHTVSDIFAGAVAGIALGVIALAAAHQILNRRYRDDRI